MVKNNLLEEKYVTSSDVDVEEDSISLELDEFFKRALPAVFHLRTLFEKDKSSQEKSLWKWVVGEI